MGTNFYLYRENKEPLHLGKQSCGWRFLFHKTDEIQNFNDFKEILKIGYIMDEYKQIWSIEDLLKLIKGRQFDKISGGETEIIDGCVFLNGEFC